MRELNDEDSVCESDDEDLDDEDYVGLKTPDSVKDNNDWVDHECLKNYEGKSSK